MLSQEPSRSPTLYNESSEHPGTSTERTSGLVDEETKRDEQQQPASGPVVTAQDWTGPNDPECALNWSLWKRIYLTSVPTFYCFTVTFASSVYTSGARDIQERFDIGPTTALLGLSLYVWGLAFGPGLAHNFATISLCRFFAGVFGSPALAVGGGTMADIWPPQYIGQTLPWFLVVAFLGPALGPVIGGFVAANKDFRWLQWVILFTAVGSYIWSLPMRETYKKTILQRRAKRLNLPPPPSFAPKGFAPELRFFFFVTILKPIKMLFSESIVLALTIWISFNFAVVYSFFSAFPYVFETVYEFDGPQIGLTFLSIGLGVVLATIACLVIDKMTYPKLHKRYNGRVPPEYRLIPACIGGFLNPISLFWFGWTADKGVVWPVPVVGAVWFGMGNVMVYTSGATYILTAYGMANGASAISANGLMRYVAGGAFPLFTAQMYRGLGIGWASSLLGFVSAALVPLPFIFFHYGHRIRARSSYIDIPAPGPGSEDK